MSVYLDDLIVSSNSAVLLNDLYQRFLLAFAEANLTPNPRKLVAPTDALTVFNCNLTQGSARVSEARIAQYFSADRSAASRKSFDAYCRKIEEGNIAS